MQRLEVLDILADIFDDINLAMSWEIRWQANGPAIFD
jgi:hypothetical protein